MKLLEMVRLSYYNTLMLILLISPIKYKLGNLDDDDDDLDQNDIDYNFAPIVDEFDQDDFVEAYNPHVKVRHIIPS